MKRWQIITAFLLCLILAGAIACNPLGDEEKTTQQFVEVVRGDLTVSVSGSGNISISNEAKLAFSSGGKIATIFVDENDEVRKGYLIAKLDTSFLELALVQAQAALDQAEYSLEQAEEPFSEDEIDSAEAAVEAAEDYLYYALWMLDKAHREEPVNGIVPSVEQWQAEVSRAQANLLAAEAQLEVILDAPDEKALAAAKSQAEAAKKAVAEAQKQLDEATIRAPSDGVVANIYAEEGDTVPAGMAIVHLIDLATMELKVEVDEIDIAEVQPGQRAIIEVDALPSLELEGKVTSVSTLAIEAGGLVLYEVTIGFDAPQDYNLKIGMSATADIIINERSNVLLVPDRAITPESQGNQVVKVMVNEEIEERLVKPGLSDGFDTEIVDGLSEGDIVVVETKVKSSTPGLF